jgi:hypothetical protein
MKTWLALVALALVVGAVAWPTSTSVAGPAQENVPVKVIPGGQKQAGDPGKKGATYYALESQTTRLTTKFRDGHIAIAERGFTGNVKATVHDREGNERARLKTNRTDGAHDTLSYEPAGGTPLQALSDPSARPTLDWVSHQAYGLVRDGAEHLVWDKGVMRPRGAAVRDVDDEVDEVETVWANGLVARLTRRDVPPNEIAPGRVVQGRAWVTDLTVNRVPAGRSMWFEQDQVFAYYLPGLTDTLVWIGPEHLKADYGGWPFKPDTTWLNLQTIAAHHFKTLIAKQGFVAKKCEAPQPNRLAQFFFPAVLANEPGCDRLHWLDGTLVRECCDDHDRCFSRAGCTERSWWQFWKSWSCDYCNLVVVSCFMAGDQIDPCRMRAWAC